LRGSASCCSNRIGVRRGRPAATAQWDVD
jgi:hypothetical protein